MKQIFLASTLFQVAGLAAGIDSGVYDTAVTPAATLEGPGAPDKLFETPSERILLLSNNAVVLEAATPIDEAPGAAALLTRFDRVIHLNDFLSPNHPNSWAPRHEDLPLWETELRSRWQLGDETVELIVESPQVNPAIALGRIFHTALIRVHSDGLMSYGPTRNFIPLTNGQRVTSLHYLPLVEGLVPRLLNEYEITPIALDRQAFANVVDEIVRDTDLGLSDEITALNPSTTAMAFGQYLSALGILTPQEEHDLHRDFVSAAHEAGMTAVVFKPHPASPPDMVQALSTHAQQLGIDFFVYSSPVIAEAAVSVLKPALVIGCFSTALVTARALYGIPAKAVQTDLLLERITPYQNSNRIPVTIADAVLDGSNAQLSAEQVTELQALLDSVSYAMQPKVAFRLKETAHDYLSKRRGANTMKYFKKKRLTSLDLPGGLPKRNRPRTVLRKSLSAGQALARETYRSFQKRQSAKRNAAKD